MSQLKLSSVLPRPAQASVRAHGTKRETADTAVSVVFRAANATLIVDVSVAVLSLSYFLQWQMLGGKFKI